MISAAAIAQNEFAELRAENEELRERLRQLEAAFFAPLPLLNELGLTLKESSALSVLYRRRGFVSKEAFYLALYGHEGERDSKVIEVWVYKLRRKLKPRGIEIKAVWGCGWRLTPASLEIIRAMIDDHRQAQLVGAAHV